MRAIMPTNCSKVFEEFTKSTDKSGPKNTVAVYFHQPFNETSQTSLAPSL